MTLNNDYCQTIAFSSESVSNYGFYRILNERHFRSKTQRRNQVQISLLCFVFEG